MTPIKHQMAWAGWLLSVLLVFSATAWADNFSDHWKDLHPKLDKLMTLVQKEQRVPSSSWVPFKEDKTKIRRKMADLIDEAIEILNVSNLSALKKDLDRTRDNVTRFEQRIGELRTKALMAPGDVAGWQVWKKDVADYEAEIVELEKKLAANQVRIDQIKADMVQSIRDIGIDIGPDQIDGLLFSITSDDDIQMITVFDNVKAITGKLRDLTISSSENMETARRYYGMYTVLLKVLIHLQQNYVDKVNGEYIPAIDGILQENLGLMDQTKKLLKDSDGNYRQVYQANLNAQTLTDRTARLYKNFLVGNRQRILASIKKSRKEYAMAENTFQTVSTAYNLLALIRQADQLFAALAELQVPDLLSFENNEMRAEFEKLTNRMLARVE